MQVLKLIAALGTIATGLYAMFAPKAIEGFTGLTAPGSRGITEFRSIFGGLFVALGAAPIVFGGADTYRMLGIGYLVIGAVRLVSMFVDQSLVRSNWISLAIEIVFGVILVI